MPAGCPHRVENLEETIAISANFVDPSNLDTVLEELRINALVDARAGELRSQLVEKCSCFMKRDRGCSDGDDDTRYGNEQGQSRVEMGGREKCDYGMDTAETRGRGPEKKCEITCDGTLKEWMDKIESRGHLKWRDFKRDANS